jgi:ABC-type multidrug transport system ATPase subunit
VIAVLAKNVRKMFGAEKALDGVSLEIGAGEF